MNILLRGWSGLTPWVYPHKLQYVKGCFINLIWSFNVLKEKNTLYPSIRKRYMPPILFSVPTLIIHKVLTLRIWSATQKCWIYLKAMSIIPVSVIISSRYGYWLYNVNKTWTPENWLIITIKISFFTSQYTQKDIIP